METKGNVKSIIAAAFDDALAGWAMVSGLVHLGGPDALEAGVPEVAVYPGWAVEAA